MASPEVLGALTLGGLRARRAEIAEVASRHGATEIAVFGSVARGDATASSDVDFVARIRRHTSGGRGEFDASELIQVWCTISSSSARPRTG